MRVAAKEAIQPERPSLSLMDRAVRPRRLTRAKMALAALGLAALAIGATAYARYGAVRTLSVPASRITVATVRRGVFSDEIALQGAVAPIETVFLDSVDGGQVEAVLAEEGSTVKAGQPIARLANRRLSLDLATAQSQLAQQQNSLVNLQIAAAQTNLAHQQAIDGADHQIAQLTADIARYTPLVDKGIYPRASLEAMQRDLAFQQSQKALHAKARDDDRERLSAQLDGAGRSAQGMAQALSLMRQGMDELVVRAPITGQLSSLAIKPGQAVLAGQRIGQIDSQGRYKLVANVDEFYLGRLAVGQAATASLDSGDLAVTVAKIFPEVHDRQFKVDLAFATDGAPALRAGQNLPLRIRLGQRPGSLVVEAGAFDESGHAASVFVVAADGHSAIRRPVRLGRRTPQTVEILSGLSPGERIVTSAGETLADIQRLLITGKAATDPAP